MFTTVFKLFLKYISHRDRNYIHYIISLVVIVLIESVSLSYHNFVSYYFIRTCFTFMSRFFTYSLVALVLDYFFIRTCFTYLSRFFTLLFSSDRSCITQFLWFCQLLSHSHLFNLPVKVLYLLITIMLAYVHNYCSDCGKWLLFLCVYYFSNFYAVSILLFLHILSFNSVYFRCISSMFLASLFYSSVS